MNRQVFGGWQISGITTHQTGTPFTVSNGSSDFSGFNQFNDRPDVAGAGRLQQDNGNPDKAFDTSYFSKTPPAGRIGTSGRNQYYGPGLANYNFTAAKKFALNGLAKLVWLKQSSSSFGRITVTVGSGVATAVGTTAGLVGGGARVIQLAMRLEFRGGPATRAYGSASKWIREL